MRIPEFEKENSDESILDEDGGVGIVLDAHVPVAVVVAADGGAVVAAGRELSICDDVASEITGHGADLVYIFRLRRAGRNAMTVGRGAGGKVIQVSAPVDRAAGVPDVVLEHFSPVLVVGQMRLADVPDLDLVSANRDCVGVAVGRERRSFAGGDFEVADGLATLGRRGNDVVAITNFFDLVLAQQGGSDDFGINTANVHASERNIGLHFLGRAGIGIELFAVLLDRDALTV